MEVIANIIEAAVVTLREGIEAALVVGILLAYLRNTGRSALTRYVFAGVGAAIIASSAGAILIQRYGGEQQRLCIARALINQPQILLADEPTGNLDEHNARVVLQLFQELHRNGHTIVLVTHDADVRRLADRRILFEHGRMVRTPRDEFAANEEEYCTHDPVPMYGRN